MKDKWVLRTGSLLTVLYLISIVINNNLWACILSPLVVFYAAVMVFNGFFFKEKVLLLKIAGIFLTLASLNWVISDICWGYLLLVLKLDTSHLLHTVTSYIYTNMFLLLAILFYGFYMLKNWNGVQLLLDTILTTGTILLLVWIIIFRQDINNIAILYSDGVSSFSLIIDIVICIWSGTWLFSIRSRKSEKVSIYSLILLACVIFAMVDMTCYYQCYLQKYEPSSLIEFWYVFALAMLAYISWYKLKLPIGKKAPAYYNVGKNGKSLLIIIIGIIALLIYLRLDIYILFIMLSLIFLYFILSSFIQKNLYQIEQIQKEKLLNEELEKNVRLRTKELYEKNIEYYNLLNLDLTTELYNRRYLFSFIEDRIQEMEEHDKVILLFIEINKLKQIKSMYGNHIGDQLRKEITRRLKQNIVCSELTLISSFSEDTFVYAQKGSETYEGAVILAEALIGICSDMYQIDNYEMRITLNIGVSIYPEDADSREELVEHADIAMLQARKQGINQIVAFDKRLGDISIRKNKIEIMLKKAIYRNEFSLVYQPQIDVKTKRVIGFEALIRWKTKDGENIPPDEFIKIAEETGCIQVIGEWVLEEVARQIFEWKKIGVSPPKIGINVSTNQLVGNHFILALKSVLERYQLLPEELDIEITESIQVEENIEVIQLLKEIREMGITISIDDFGTGYASFNYLKHLPVDRIKIAKFLIDIVDKDEFDHQIIESLIRISRVRNIRVLAEGVETESQLKSLEQLSCDEVQGYYYGRPLTPIDAYLKCLCVK